MKDVLKPCPLCGEELFHRVEPFADGSNPLHTAYCHCGFVFSDDCANEEFIEQCNRRYADWTPCAEGLLEPDDGQFVNVTYECRGERKSSSATYHKLSGNYYGCDKYRSMMVGVLAWQPLPEPYNPDQFREPTKMMQED